MKLSEKGKTLIKEFEGYKDVAYKCQAGVWTLGYGTTKGIKKGDICTPDEADVWFDRDNAQFERELNDALHGVPVNQNQFDALMSFVYNFGITNFRASTLLKVIRKNPDDLNEVSKQLRRWVNAGGERSRGVVLRREKEVKLYCTNSI